MNFEHCTFANYSQGYRNTPSFLFKDYYKSINEQIVFRPFDNAQFTNCIFDGNGITEFICDTVGKEITGLNTNVLFNSCSLKSEDTLSNYILNNCYFNILNHFRNTENWNFELTENSEAINKGTNSIVTEDILNLPRTIPNDLGSHEYQ